MSPMLATTPKVSREDTGNKFSVYPLMWPRTEGPKMMPVMTSAITAGSATQRWGESGCLHTRSEQQRGSELMYA